VFDRVLYRALALGQEGIRGERLGQQNVEGRR
jgi:hypothetical protein